jgi:hypothetical protein
MTNSNSFVQLTCITGLLGLLSACDNNGGFSSANNKKEERRITQQPNGANADPNGIGSKKTTVGMDPNRGENWNDGTDPQPSAGGINPAPVTNQETKKDSELAQIQTDFKGWCSKAAEVEPVASGRLKVLYTEFCGVGNPTLTKNLIASAFVGTGEPTFTDLIPLTSTGAITSYRFAIALKLPISIKDHFEKVGPKAGDVNEIKKLQESAGGGTSAVVTLLQTHPASGKYHVQGFTTNSKVTKPVLITTVTSEADTRNDRFNLIDGEQVMYTQYTSRAVQTLKNFDYLAAGVKVENSAYLIVVVDAALENKGFTTVAEDQVRTLAVIGIKQMYSLAASAK